MPGALFSYADLFSGIGGFHALLSHLGGECVFASDIDQRARSVYENNWIDGPPVAGDITQIEASAVPGHDVLAAGFPCQAFSKSGLQRGINEARGTLFYDVLRVLERHQPSLVLLENVRNLAGPRHEDTWRTVIRLLREQGYRVPSLPTVFSPHLLPPHLGGAPQVRDRVYIVGLHVGRDAAQKAVYDEPLVRREPVDGWQPTSWSLAEHLLDPLTGADLPRSALSDQEQRWLHVWDDFVARMWRRRGRRLPGFPLWLDHFRHRARGLADMPPWKQQLVIANRDFYRENHEEIDEWRWQWRRELRDFPASRRKLEWQATTATSLSQCALQFRPSGIRAKDPTYLPALVAMTQTPVIGPLGRRLTVREAARLQGLPEWFDFGSQPDWASFKQLGNGINIGAAWWVLRQYVKRHEKLLPAHVSQPILQASPPLAGALLRPQRPRSVA